MLLVELAREGGVDNPKRVLVTVCSVEDQLAPSPIISDAFPV